MTTLYKTLITYLLLSCLEIGAQTPIDLVQLQPDVEFDNIHVQKLSTDSLSTSFAIWIKQSVKIHKHVYHTEHVYVMEGEGDFVLGDSILPIKMGDWITVPKNTWHGLDVSSKNPVKVISVQSPEFKGEDRIFKNQ